MPKALDLTNQKFGRWTVISLSNSHKGKGRYWNCQCECGNEALVSGGTLRSGASKSCGCFKVEMQTSHGMYNTPEYRAWVDMKTRCLKEDHKSYHNYGGRGIKICNRWLESFENFYSDMGNRPSNKHSLDRINNDSDYEPNNCRWTTSKEQNSNKRTNTAIEFNGEINTRTKWAEILGINHETIRFRLSHGWEVKDAFTIKTGSVKRFRNKTGQFTETNKLGLT